MITVERMTDGHIPQIAAIEKECFSRPWSEHSLLMMTHEPCCGFVGLAPDGSVAAYGGMFCVLDEGQITNIATRPDFRRRGGARAVLGALIREAESRGLAFLSLDVREGNTPARTMYHAAGFYEVGRRPGYYSLPTEAAIIMNRDIKC